MQLNSLYQTPLFSFLDEALKGVAIRKDVTKPHIITFSTIENVSYSWIHWLNLNFRVIATDFLRASAHKKTVCHKVLKQKHKF